MTVAARNPSPSDRLSVLASEIAAKLMIARRHGQATLAALMDVGDRLAEAKEALDHGQWDDWLSANFALSDRTARLYMQLAGHRKRVEAKMATVAELGVRGALEQIHEDQIYEGNVKRNREALARGWEPKPASVRHPRLPPSELETAINTLMMHIRLKREMMEQHGQREEFDWQFLAAIRVLGIVNSGGR